MSDSLYIDIFTNLEECRYMCNLHGGYKIYETEQYTVYEKAWRNFKRKSTRYIIFVAGRNDSDLHFRIKTKGHYNSYYYNKNKQEAKQKAWNMIKEYYHEKI